MKNSTLLCKAFSLSLFLLASATALIAQTATDWIGAWDGAIEIPGRKLEISIRLEQSGGAWKGSLDIPVQFIKEMALDELSIEGTAIAFKLSKVPGNASFKGSISADRSKISGDFLQGGMTLPMNLLKKNAAEAARAEQKLAEAVAKIRHLADSLRILTGVPGLGFGIVKDGKVVLSEGFGYKDLEAKAPVSAKTQFAIGSSTKAFTTTCLALLSQEGKLDWDEPVLTYLPDFKLYDEFATREMTAEDLLTHRSGLPRHDFLWYGSTLSRQGMYGRLRYLEPSESFRSEFQYQNLMYMTAGILTEKLSGKSWEAFVRERIFQPIGMSNSNLSVIDLLKAADRALPYQKDKKEAVVQMDYRNIDAVGPAGSINSSVEDMLRWVQFHLDLGKSNGKELLDAGEVRNLHSPHFLVSGSMAARLGGAGVTDLTYGLGWFNYNYRGTRVVQHGGNIDGFSALVFLLPEQNTGMVLLTNLNGNALTSVLAHTSADLLLDREPFDWYATTYGKDKKAEEEKKEPEKKRITGTTPHHPLATYAGEYEHPGYGILEVTLREGKLASRYNGIELPLEHWHFETFMGKNEVLEMESLVTFQTNADGKVVSLSISLEPSVADLIFKKMPPAKLSDLAFLTTCTGDYQLETAVCNIALKGGKLVATLPGQPAYQLEPYQGNEFRLKGLSGYSVEFFFDAQGKAKELKFYQPDGVYSAVRK